ncbi:MAG: DUF3822 family protein, partial [Bacteroidota bacterium]
KNNITNYKLSILCGVDSLSYCIHGLDEGTLVLKQFDLFKNQTLDSEAIIIDSFKEIWEIDSLLSLAFPNVSVALIRPSYTIIPTKFYQPNKKADYLKPLKSAANTQEIYQANDLDGISAKLIFSFPQVVANFFDGQFHNGVKYFNSLTPLINGIAQKMVQLDGKHLWLNVHPHLLQILFFDGQELIFSNQFPFETEKDFLYYVMLIYNQFKLNPEEIPLHISGQLVKESAIYKSLYRYVRHISFLNISTTHQLNTHLIAHPHYFFFDLLSI